MKTAILSDIHANYQALRAVVEHARTNGCQAFLSLGDVVGYGPQPRECIDLLMQIAATNILGNHDGYLVEGETCQRSKVVAKIIEHHRTLVTGTQLEWLAKSFSHLVIDDMMFVHGGPRDHRDQYLYKVSEALIPAGFRWLFSGHTHVQIKVRFAARSYCNPGSVGQPRDGDWRAAYAIVDAGEVHLQRVAYDVDATARAMKEAGFDPFCYENLFIGAQIGGRKDAVEIIRNDGEEIEQI